MLPLDPTYGEYTHVAERVIGCRIDRLRLSRADGYRVDPEALQQALSRGPDLAVLVNPNSPTGQYLPRAVLERVLKGVSGSRPDSGSTRPMSTTWAPKSPWSSSRQDPQI